MEEGDELKGYWAASCKHGGSLTRGSLRTRLPPPACRMRRAHPTHTSMPVAILMPGPKPCDCVTVPKLWPCDLCDSANHDVTSSLHPPCP